MRKMNLAFLLSLITTMLFVASCQNKGGADVKLKSEDDKTFYVMGFMLGSNLQRLNLTDQELGALYKGLLASAKGKEAEVDMAIYQPKIQTLFKDRMDKIANKEKEAGTKYLDDYLKKNKNAKKTDSGLVYEVLKEGTGEAPKETDKVEVHYHGTLTSGEVFDSSVDRGKTIEFPLNRVIKGWTEGLQLVKEGGKIRLVIPSDLAYGEQGAPPKIPGGATLIFDVELFKINPEPKEGEEALPEGHTEDDGHDH